jgi:hypothetical protein
LRQTICDYVKDLGIDDHSYVAYSDLNILQTIMATAMLNT